jgi:DNA topoisomerase I
LRLVCDRELEIEKFVPREYWSLVATLATPRGETFEARLVGAEGQKIQRLDIGTGREAEEFKRALEHAAFTVGSVEAKPARRNPYPPFMTSTLQQEASRKLGFAPAHTMRIAQRLYEGIDLDGETVGLITYMRTDGVDIAPEAITAARRVIEADYGATYVPPSPRQYVSKSKNAQEAHEAIRPTDLARRPAEIRKLLEPDQAKLYELIWLRTIASQMESAELERTTVDIVAKAGGRTIDLRATGTVVKFDGFLTLYNEDQDDKSDDEDSNRLPEMAAGEALSKREIAATQHFTEPPPRYSEASLVKRMEELGIGRPSTYASILQVLKDRGYVRLDKKRLVPEDKGRVLTAFLENFFQKYVEYDFTASLEEQLDKISNNELPYKEVLRDFWRDFTGAVGEIKELRVAQVIDALDEMLAPHLFPPNKDGTDPRKCPNCENGRIGLKLGRFGGFIGCSNYPECKFTRQLSAGPDGNGGGMRKLGEDPETGLEVTVRSGRFGSYLQLGEAETREPAQRRLARRHRARAGDQAPVAAARDRQTPQRRRTDRGRYRPVRSLREARQDLRQHRRRRGHPQHRPQPGRDADRGEEGQPRKGPPVRRRSRQAGRRASAEGRDDRREERPLRTLRQPRRRQCQPAQRQDARDHLARRGRGTARCARRARRRIDGAPQAAGPQGTRQGRSRRQARGQGQAQEARRRGARLGQACEKVQARRRMIGWRCGRGVLKFAVSGRAPRSPSIRIRPVIG